MNDSNDDVLLVISTLPDRTSAERVARALIEGHAAACVNMLAECTSFYRWQEKLHSDSEIPLLIKTTRRAYPRLEQIIRMHHPYELPEIVAVPVDTGLPGYMHWVVQETRPHDPEK